MGLVVHADADRWSVTRDGQAIGKLATFVRPDGRRFLSFSDCTREAYRPLLDAAVDALRDEDAYVTVREEDREATEELSAAGFTLNRREHLYLLPTDPEHTGLAAARVPDGVEFISAAAADIDRLRELDDALRQDIPGADGWRNDPELFAGDTFDDPGFYPETYLVARDRATSAYTGLVRVWMNPGGPRLGMIGVLADHRRHGLAAALIGQTFAVLHARGQAEATTEVDETNDASNALMARLGGLRTGAELELILRPKARRGT